jgi:hypothetical protein
LDDLNKKLVKEVFDVSTLPVIIILQVCGTVVALFSVWQAGGKLRNSILTVFVLGASLAGGYSAYVQDQSNNEYQKENITLSQKIASTSQEIASSAGQTAKDMNRLVTNVATLVERGFTGEKANAATPEQINESDKSNQILKSNVRKSSGTTIQYFLQDVDAKIVTNELTNLGFILEESESRVNYRTNAIWFGSAVSLEDVKLVAYTLIRAGLRIQAIRPFREESKEGDSQKIQIGADADYSYSPAWDVYEIQEAPKFERIE